MLCAFQQAFAESTAQWARAGKGALGVVTGRTSTFSTVAGTATFQKPESDLSGFKVLPCWVKVRKDLEIAPDGTREMAQWVLSRTVT